MFWSKTKLVLKAAALLLVVGASALIITTKINGGKFLSVQSNSMVPTFSRGSLVEIMPTPLKQLKVGNIINFVDPSNKQISLTHRIIQTPNSHNDYKFVTKGDANKVHDTPIFSSAIIGKERLAIPYVGYLTNFVNKPLGLILIIYIPALIIIIEEVLRLAAYYKKQQPYVAFGHSFNGVNSSGNSRWLHKATIVTILAFITSAFFTLPAQAALKGNATLIDTTITTAIITPPPNNTCNNNTNIDINNNSSQTGTAGTVTNSGNTTSGTTNSGSVNQSDSTSVNINVDNGC